MLTMVFSGCAKIADGQTVGQKLDRAFAKASFALIDAGDNIGKIKTPDTLPDSTVSAFTTSISDSALITTLAVSDAAITAAIKTDLVRDPHLTAAKIDVDTRRGVVSLTGTTAAESQRLRAEQIARTNKDVVRVDNFVRTNPL
jgi:hypothetical protein